MVDNQEDKTKLLLIEDDDLVRDSLSLYLQDCGYDVIKAEDGEIALAIFSSVKPDVVISDLKMPHIDGLTVLEALADYDTDIPFIVVSGAGKMQEAVKALRLGAHDYFVKPIADLELLEYSIERALEQKKLKEQNQRYALQLEAKNEQILKSLKVFKRDQAAALQVQKAMLPVSDFSSKYNELEYLWEPSLSVSGDFLDCFEVTDRFTVFYLVDVAGHGVPAAFITVFLKHLSNELIKDFKNAENRTMYIRPSLILSIINNRLLEAQLDKPATMVLCIHDKLRCQIQYSVAGHFPLPILKRKGEPATYLSSGGLALGLMKDINWTTKKISARPGDEIIICSDGVFELMSSGKVQENEEKLLQMVNKSQNLAEIREKLGLNKASELIDDIAIMKFKVSNNDK